MAKKVSGREQKRTKPLHIMLTDGEHKMLNETAKARGLSLSSYGRLVMLDAAKAAR